jgi:hypothetical protein
MKACELQSIRLLFRVLTICSLRSNDEPSMRRSASEWLITLHMHPAPVLTDDAAAAAADAAAANSATHLKRVSRFIDTFCASGWTRATCESIDPMPPQDSHEFKVVNKNFFATQFLEALLPAVGIPNYVQVFTSEKKDQVCLRPNEMQFMQYVQVFMSEDQRQRLKQLRDLSSEDFEARTQDIVDKKRTLSEKEIQSRIEQKKGEASELVRFQIAPYAPTVQRDLTPRFFSIRRCAERCRSGWIFGADPRVHLIKLGKKLRTLFEIMVSRLRMQPRLLKSANCLVRRIINELSKIRFCFS